MLIQYIGNILADIGATPLLVRIPVRLAVVANIQVENFVNRGHDLGKLFLCEVDSLAHGEHLEFGCRLPNRDARLQVPT
jgi:hypothetical protein